SFERLRRPIPPEVRVMASDPHRWRVLAVVATAFFMTILDVSIVNVALPSIGRDLNFSQANLQWVITAYAIAFGGFLLLGGRAGLALLVYGISEAPEVGWATARTILVLIASGALLVGFLVRERRIHDPLMPFHIFRVRTVAGANAVGALLGAVIFANFFLLTLYVQDVLGYSALKTGVTFVATAGTAVIAAGVAQALTTKVGAKPIIV